MILGIFKICSYNSQLRDNHFLYAVALALFFLGFVSQYAFAAFQNLGVIYFVQLQFWRFSEFLTNYQEDAKGDCLATRHFHLFSRRPLEESLAATTLPKGLLKVVSKRWFEFCPESKFRYPLFTSI